MKVLVIICGHAFEPLWRENVKVLREIFADAHFCGISNQDDFQNYEDLIEFRYKLINTKGQWSKVCDFITDHRDELDYDWFVKIRPDLKLLEPVPWGQLSIGAVNARARVYNGPAHIRYGMSINGEGKWKNVGDVKHERYEHDVVLDDQFFFFHRGVVDRNVFDKDTSDQKEHEWTMTATLKKRGASLYVVGIHAELSKYHCFSGDIP